MHLSEDILINDKGFIVIRIRKVTTWTFILSEDILIIMDCN